MFIELFQSFCDNVVEWLVGLGLSTATVYLVFRIVKFVIYSLFMKKRATAKKQAEVTSEQKAISEGVANSLEVKFTNLEAKLDDISNRLSNIETSLSNSSNETIENLAIDVEAYQTVVLSQDESLAEEYESVKSELIASSKQAKAVIADVAETTSTIATNITNAVESNEDAIIKSAEDVATTVNAIKKTVKKSKEKVESIIYE